MKRSRNSPGKGLDITSKVRAVRKVREMIEKHPELPAGTAVGSVRQDRDSR